MSYIYLKQFGSYFKLVVTFNWYQYTHTHTHIYIYIYIFQLVSETYNVSFSIGIKNLQDILNWYQDIFNWYLLVS